MVRTKLAQLRYENQERRRCAAPLLARLPRRAQPFEARPGASRDQHRAGHADQDRSCITLSGTALGRFLRRPQFTAAASGAGTTGRPHAIGSAQALGLPSARVDNPWRLPGGGPEPEGRGCRSGVAFSGWPC